MDEKPPRAAGRVLLVVLFVMYLFLLAWIVLWKLEIPFVGGGGLRQIKLVPFAATAGAGASAPFEIVANFVLFVPFGIYLCLLAPSWPWQQAACAIAGASLILEVAQYVLAVGSSDITDLIVNTAGGLVGIGLLNLARRRLQTRTTIVMTRLCLIGTVLALLAIGIFITSDLRYGPRDVAVVSNDFRALPNNGTQARVTAPGLNRAAFGQR